MNREQNCLPLKLKCCLILLDNYITLELYYFVLKAIIYTKKNYFIIFCIQNCKLTFELPLFSDFVRLFEKLNTVQGSYESRIKVVKEVIHEAGRFKRHSLVKLISQFLDSMGDNDIIYTNSLSQIQNVRVNGHSRQMEMCNKNLMSAISYKGGDLDITQFA